MTGRRAAAPRCALGVFLGASCRHQHQSIQRWPLAKERAGTRRLWFMMETHNTHKMCSRSRTRLSPSAKEQKSSST